MTWLVYWTDGFPHWEWSVRNADGFPVHNGTGMAFTRSGATRRAKRRARKLLREQHLREKHRYSGEVTA